MHDCILLELRRPMSVSDLGDLILIIKQIIKTVQ